MAVTFGFHNSLNGDRTYNAKQMSSLFDGIINDGVFMSIGSAFHVKADSAMNITVGVGRAWFDSTWTYNNAELYLELDPSEVVLNRIDAVVLEVNSTDAVRANMIKVIKGTPATVPVEPAIVKNTLVNQYVLAYIYVGKNVSEITQANITNKVGTSDVPYITGILKTVNIEDMIDQWQSDFMNWSVNKKLEFMQWFSTIQDILDTNTAGNLLNMINELRLDVEKQLGNYNSYSSGKDPDGIFVTVTYKRTDGSIYMISQLSNKNAMDNYETLTWTFFEDNGVTIIYTVAWSLGYDADGDITSKVVS